MRLLKTVNFGTDCTGLTTVGYSLVNDDGTINQARTTTEVFETITNSGVYASYIDFDQEWNGIVLWDDGQDERTYASEEYNYLLEDTTSTINLTVQEIERDGGKLDIVSDDLKRVLGLVHENLFIDLPTYDDANNLIGARLRIYSTPSSVGTDNDVLATYAISSDTDDEPGKFTNWKQERI